MTTCAERDALAAHPELSRLRDLRAAGFRFFPVTERRNIIELRAVRALPNWIDSFVLRAPEDAGAVRRDPAGQLVWRRAGSLAEVIDGLLALPAPNAGSAR